MVAPFVANRMAFKAFFFPYRYQLPEREQKLADKAKTVAFRYREQMICGYEWGSGPTILFVHGWSSRTTQFIYFIKKYVDAGYRCIGVDMPGHGRSEGKHSDVIQFGETLMEFVRMMGSVDHVVAHSMGGTAVMYAVKRGFKIKDVVILTTPAVAEDILEVSRLRMNASVKTRDNLRKEILKRYHSDLDEYVAATIAKTITMPPTLLIYDDSDEDAPAHHGEILQKEIPGSRLEITHGLGHTRILKDETTISRVLEFFRASH